MLLRSVSRFFRYAAATALGIGGVIQLVLSFSSEGEELLLRLGFGAAGVIVSGVLFKSM